MRRFSLGWLTLYFCIGSFGSFGIGAAIQGCVVSDRNNDIEQIKDWNVKTKAAHDRTAWLLRAAQGQGKDEAVDFFAKLKGWLDSPEFKDKNLAAVLARAKLLKDASPDLLATLDPDKKWVRLRAIADDKFYAEAVELDKQFPLTEALRRTKTIPEPGFKPPFELKPVPEPKGAFFTRGWWFWCWIASALAFVLLGSLVYFIDGSDGRYHLVLSYPWNRPLGLLYCAAAAPATVPVLVGYGGYRLLTAEWDANLPGIGRAFEALAYRYRLLRRLPAPVIQPIVPPDVGGLAAVPAPAAEVPAPAAPVPDGPRWYVVNSGLSLGLSHLLEAKGIRLFPISINEPEKLKAFGVPGADIAAFERTLRLDGGGSEDKDTDIEKTVRRTYKRTVGKIDIAGFEKKYLDLLKKILRTVSAYADGIDIAVSVHGSKTVQPVASEERINVFYDATPSPAPQVHETPKAFGKDRGESGNFTLVQPLAESGLVIRDADGNAVAQIVDGCVYVLVSGLLARAVDTKEAWPAEALARLLHEAVACALEQKRENDRDEAKSERWRAALDAHREKYVELCFKRFERSKAKLDEKIAGCEEEIVEAGKKMTAALKKKRQAETDRLAFVEKASVAEKERLRKEFGQLAASKCVVGVRCMDDGVEVQTRTVFIPWQGRRYKIGRFLIRLHDQGRVSIVNVANTASGTTYHHPHIRNDGDPCFGKMQEAVAKLMADRQYATVVNLLFRFFESYNHHDGVEHISKWKEVTGETDG